MSAAQPTPETVLRELARPPCRNPTRARVHTSHRWSLLRRLAWDPPSNPKNENDMSWGSYILAVGMLFPLVCLLAPVIVLVAATLGVLGYWQQLPPGTLILVGLAVYVPFLGLMVVANLVARRYRRDGWLAAHEVGYWTKLGDDHPELAAALVGWLAHPRTQAEGARARRVAKRYIANKNWHACLLATAQADRQDLEALEAATQEGAWGAKILCHQLHAAVPEASLPCLPARRL